MTNKTVDDFLNENENNVDYALRWASYEGNLHVVKILMEEKGADIHAQNDVAFREACRMGHMDTVLYLAEKGADIFVFNNEALLWATVYGHKKIVEFLVMKGCDVKEAMFWAEKSKQFEIVDFLKSL